jgi:hypothetical protein
MMIGNWFNLTVGKGMDFHIDSLIKFSYFQPSQNYIH